MKAAVETFSRSRNLHVGDTVTARGVEAVASHSSAVKEIECVQAEVIDRWENNHSENERFDLVRFFEERGVKFGGNPSERNPGGSESINVEIEEKYFPSPFFVHLWS